MNLRISIHELDKDRTITHDYDRIGDGYETWCTCGKKITGKSVAYWSDVVKAHEKHQRSEAVITDAAGMTNDELATKLLEVVENGISDYGVEWMAEAASRLRAAKW